MVESFRAITDVRSNNKHDVNLLHFIIETVEKELPEVLKLRKELSVVYEAAKFSRTEMETELKAIQETLRELEAELHTQKSKPSVISGTDSEATTSDATKILRYKDDKFIEVVEAFVKAARKQLVELETNNNDMAQKV